MGGKSALEELAPRIPAKPLILLDRAAGDLEYQKLYYMTPQASTALPPRMKRHLLTPVNTRPNRPNTSQGLPRVYLQVEHGTEVDGGFDSAGQGQSCAL
jgi:hypothetical protein